MRDAVCEMLGFAISVGGGGGHVAVHSVEGRSELLRVINNHILSIRNLPLTLRHGLIHEANG